MNAGKNCNDFAFFALRRSGHHAVMVWLAYHFPLPVVLLNDVTPYTDPYVTAKYPDDWDKISPWMVSLRGNVENVRCIYKECIMRSYQDIDLAKLCSGEDIISDQLHTFGRSDNTFVVLVLRDPFNMLASRTLKPTPLSRFVRPNDFLNMWELYANEFLGKTNFLGPKVSVNFNLWCIDKEYRKHLSKLFHLHFTDDGRNVVPAAGGGSTFDLLRYDGRGNEMDVANRWQKCATLPWFRHAFTDRRHLGAMYREIFTSNSAIDMFMNEMGI